MKPEPPKMVARAMVMGVAGSWDCGFS